MYHNKENTKSGFTLIELSIVIIIIGLLIGGIVVGKNLISTSRMTMARTLTNSSPVNGIEDLVLWLETTSKDSFTASERIDGSSVTTWYDINQQSTTKFNVIQATPVSEQPIYTSNAVNNLPALSFDGIDDFFDANWSFVTDSNFTIFIVMQRVGVGAGQNTILGGTGTGTITWRIATGSTSGFAANSRFMVVYTGAINDPGPHILTGIDRGAIKEHFIDGSSEGTEVNSARANNTNPPNQSFVGKGFGGVFKGYIGEIIGYERELSPFEIDQIEEYLSKKWKIKLSS